MQRSFSTVCLAAAILAGLSTPVPATIPSFGLLGEPGQNYTFTRAGAPVGAAISGPVGPYPGGRGSNTPAELHGFFCIDYLKAATWNTSYPGAGCGVRDPIPGKTEAQLVEAAYLSRLHQPGGASANTYLYQGPISFATWEIMDPAPGHVPIDPAAQPYIREARQAYNAHSVTAANYPNTRIFVPDDHSIRDFATLSEGVPEPGTLVLFLTGILLIGVGRFRR